MIHLKDLYIHIISITAACNLIFIFKYNFKKITSTSQTKTHIRHYCICYIRKRINIKINLIINLRHKRTVDEEENYISTNFF